MTADVVLVGRKALATEMFVGAVYKYLAAKYHGSATGKAFSGVSLMEKEHILFWTEFLQKRGAATTHIGFNKLRLLLYKLMLSIIGKAFTLRIMEISEDQAIEMYSSTVEIPGLLDEEREHITGIIGEELVHEKLLIDEEASLGSLTAYTKDAVLGMSDGLVETLSVTTGLAGATGSTLAVAISGLVVGVAGGVSMAISMYTSTRSQRQVNEGILHRISYASRFVGNFFKGQVRNHLEKKGYSNKLAAEVAEETARDRRLLSSVVAEQEYGLREENLGSPAKASLYASLSNLVASLIPLLPYFFISNITTALIVSLLLATVALAITGFFVSILAHMTPGKKIGEMMLTGLGSAALTYGIGRLASLFLGTRG